MEKLHSDSNKKETIFLATSQVCTVQIKSICDLGIEICHDSDSTFKIRSMDYSYKKMSEHHKPYIHHHSFHCLYQFYLLLQNIIICQNWIVKKLFYMLVICVQQQYIVPPESYLQASQTKFLNCQNTFQFVYS